ncbi:MAG: methylmalonyl Co-A mutase-associated GTPase MeaB, partial [Bryobacteraceae bacterium]
MAGDTRALARAATAIENRDPAVRPVLSALESHSRHRSLVLGITGPPGAGKSTLVDQLARSYRAQGKTVAIIAVDPSSAVTGGALLGDRIRMQSHHADAGIFIRSMATRGALGGLAESTAGLVRLFSAAGRDVVIVETVGVGQAEIEIARIAAITIVVLVPGMGDDIQAFKAGIMEIADIFVINKADHPGADKMEQELKGQQSLGHRADGWVPPIIRTIATDATGIDSLMEAIARTPLSESESESEVGQAIRLPRTPIQIDHIGIAVKSIDSALPFYTTTVGLAVASREIVPEEKVAVAMLPAGGPRLELLEALTPDSTIAKFIGKRGEGLHHIALRVPDLAAAVERLRESGACILNEPRQGAGGHEYVFVHPSSTG